MITVAEQLRELADEIEKDQREGIESHLIIVYVVGCLRRIADGAE